MSAFESILMRGVKKILGCSSKTCNETWWYKFLLTYMPAYRYPKQLFDQEWKTKPRKGRQRKSWRKYMYMYVNELFELLDQGELRTVSIKHLYVKCR